MTFWLIAALVVAWLALSLLITWHVGRSLRPQHDHRAADERAARARLAPRTGLVAASPIDPPSSDGGRGRGSAPAA